MRAEFGGSYRAERCVCPAVRVGARGIWGPLRQTVAWLAGHTHGPDWDLKSSGDWYKEEYGIKDPPEDPKA